MPSEAIHRHRGRRSRSARKQRALTAAIRAAPGVGVKPPEREGRFYPRHERDIFGRELPREEQPPDTHWTGFGRYVEVCDKCRHPGDNPSCKTCHGNYYTRPTIHGRRSA